MIAYACPDIPDVASVPYVSTSRQAVGPSKANEEFHISPNCSMIVPMTRTLQLEARHTQQRMHVPVVVPRQTAPSAAFHPHDVGDNSRASISGSPWPSRHDFQSSSGGELSHDVFPLDYLGINTHLSGSSRSLEQCIPTSNRRHQDVLVDRNVRQASTVGPIRDRKSKGFTTCRPRILTSFERQPTSGDMRKQTHTYNIDLDKVEGEGHHL
jgi:hypothetical protein